MSADDQDDSERERERGTEKGTDDSGERGQRPPEVVKVRVEEWAAAAAAPTSEHVPFAARTASLLNASVGPNSEEIQCYFVPWLKSTHNSALFSEEKEVNLQCREQCFPFRCW